MGRLLRLLITVILSLSGGVAAAVEPIRVGVTMARSGKYEEFGREQLRGIQMWVDDINERGSLLGRPVELVYYDDESDRETCARLYEKLITEDEVDLLINPYSSGLTLAASDVAERHGFPMVVAASAPTIWERGCENVFGIYTPSDHNMDPIMELASAKGLQRVAVAYADTDFPRGVAEGVRARAEELNLEIVFDEPYDRNIPEFTGLIARLNETRPDVVIVGSYLNDSVAFLLEAKAQGLEPQIFAFSGGPALIEFGAAVGVENAEGVMSSAQWKRGQHMPGSFDFSFRFRRRYGRNASYQAAGGYAAGQVLEAAVRLAGSVDKDKVRKQLRDLKFRSLLGHYRVDETGRQVGKPIYVMQWQNGRRRLIFPEELARFEFVYPFPPWTARAEWIPTPVDEDDSDIY